MTNPVDTATSVGAMAAFLAVSIGGVTVEHFVLGAGSYMVGAGCRFALKVSKAAEADQPIKWGSAVAALAVAPFLGAFASMVTYFGASLAHFEGDAAICIILALTALRGQEGIQALGSFVIQFIPEKFRGIVSSNQGPK